MPRRSASARVKLALLVVSALTIVAVTLAVVPSRPATADLDAPTGAVARALGPSNDPPPGDAPPGMVWIPAGDFLMGSDDPMFAVARPVHRVAVDGFWMDATEVTNTAFARFVDATGYVTAAERAPRLEDFPDASPELLVAGSIVFSAPHAPVPLDNPMQWWAYVPGANWRHPEGPSSNLDGRDDHPVVHIAYEDAVAYAAWAGNRLPTEAEWEYAARGRRTREPFVWGSEPLPGGAHQANIHQGHFPHENTADDGYVATAPVQAFPANDFGLYGMSGNVWEWTTDWYRPDTYARRAPATLDQAVRNPTGPPSSLDPAEPGVPKRVQKGGSFLCTDQYCGRYRPGGRGKGAIDSPANHVGLRTVR